MRIQQVARNNSFKIINNSNNNIIELRAEFVSVLLQVSRIRYIDDTIVDSESITMH